MQEMQRLGLPMCCTALPAASEEHCCAPTAWRGLRTRSTLRWAAMARYLLRPACHLHMKQQICMRKSHFQASSRIQGTAEILAKADSELA